MIKIVASTEVNGKKVTTSFQSKVNKHISLNDLQRLTVFTNSQIMQGRMVTVNYKITYDNKGCIAGMSSKVLMKFINKVIPLYENIIDSINRNL